MKCISKHLKKLQEEKLIAKEDGEGGAPAGVGGDGGVVAPSDGGATSDSSDIVSPDTEPKATGLSTTDILGKCDHRKDGVFGPGCFHLPCVWSIPCYRLPKKKKRKKLKYANLVNEEDQFNLFERDAKYVIQKEIDKAQKWLDRIDPEISLEYTEDYEFDGEKSDWVAALDQENQENIKTFTVAFNLKALYEFLYEQGLEMDELELNLQIKVSLWHEIGHALINYFRDMEIYDFEVSGVEEEKLVEEFAKYQIKKFTGVYKSRLNDFVNEIFSKQEANEEEVQETKGDILTDFKQPINLANKKRFLGKNDGPLQGKKFVVSDILIPGSSNLFANQNNKDVVAAINRHGMLCLQVEAQPEDEDEQDFLKLSVDDRKRFVDIILNIQKYLDDPKDDFELDVASEFEKVSEEDRKKLADRYSMLIGGTRQIWYRPTLIDVIRICHIGGVGSLPLELLAKLDDHDHQHQKRYIESNQLNESVADHSFVKDMYRLQSMKSHFAPDRWTLLTNDYKADTDLGYDVYTIRLTKSNGTGTNYIFSSGVLFGYDESDTRLQTVYYIEPCEVIYMLQKGEVLSGDDKNVSTRLLWACFQNLVQKKAFAGHADRRTGYN